MATHFSILARTILWMEEPGGLQSVGERKELGMTERLSAHVLLRFINLSLSPECQ